MHEILHILGLCGEKHLSFIALFTEPTLTTEIWKMRYYFGRMATTLQGAASLLGIT
jgi:hypothetical protein